MIHCLDSANRINRLIYVTYSSQRLTATVSCFLKQAWGWDPKWALDRKIIHCSFSSYWVQDLSCSKQSHTTNLVVGTGQLEI